MDFSEVLQVILSYDSSPESSTRNTVESVTLDYRDHPHKDTFLFTAQCLWTESTEDGAIPGASRSCHQTCMAEPQPIAGIAKKMLKQSRTYFSTMPVNLSARSTDQQAYRAEGERCFELKLFIFCQIVRICIPLPKLCSAVRKKTFYLQHQLHQIPEFGSCRN